MAKGGTPSQGLWMPPRVATLFVAASDSLDKCRAQADYICDGVADEVQINAALADLPAGGGRVVLSEGNFILADPIIVPGDYITIEGQNFATAIDGAGLATGEHGIVISGIAGSKVKNLVIYTRGGGGKVCHCIFIEAAYDTTLVEDVAIVESDSDGIHIEGTESDNIVIRGCWIASTDNHGINIVPDVTEQSLRFSIYNNFITATGASGINFGQCVGHYYHKIYNNLMTSIGDNGIDYGIATVPTFGLMESEIKDNYIYGAIANGIRLLSDSNNNFFENNFISSCGGYGINIGGPTCINNRLMNNVLIGNVSGAAQDLGVGTQLPFIFIPVPNPSTNIGAHPAEQLTDDLE
ncbi:MAG: right-handed parallel beta-helix repeat-containing protein, partial [Candidatus Omnitrophica bacterium]|nr:right-handed parallel beta-helix repeat-containing protein [Candidatus Omnitrophota bacterium]